MSLSHAVDRIDRELVPGFKSEGLRERDPGETLNLSNDPAYAEIKTALKGQFFAYFDKYAESYADLWNGGALIRHSERKRLWGEIWGADWHPVYAQERAHA